MMSAEMLPFRRLRPLRPRLDGINLTKAIAVNRES